MKTQIIRMVCFISVYTVFVSPGMPNDDFYAYYTKLPGNFELLEDYQDQLFGGYSDLVVCIGERGKVIFSLNTSYLPVWQIDQETWPFEEIVPRKGDGPPHRPDILSKYSHVRLIQQSPDTITVYWRYFPNMDYVEWDGVVEEYFEFSSDLKVRRSIQIAGAAIDDWKNQKGKIIQVLQFSNDGIKLVSEKKTKNPPEEKPPAPDSSVGASNNEYKSLWFSFDLKDNDDGIYVSENLSGKIYPVKGNKALWKNGVSGSALQFDGYNTGISVSGLFTVTNSKGISLQGWIALAAYPFDWPRLFINPNGIKRAFILALIRMVIPVFMLPVEIGGFLW